MLAIDPGRDKCGIAVVGEDGRVLYQGIVAAAQVGGETARLLTEYRAKHLVVGDRTGAKDVCRALDAAGLALTPVLVDEHHSSEEGRRRFVRDNPPRGWRRLIPHAFRTPTRPYDDYVAVLLAERYLQEGARANRPWFARR